MPAFQNILVLINRRAGLGASIDRIRRAFYAAWEKQGTLVSYQFCHDADDTTRKARAAAAGTYDAVIVAGGDGSVNLAGRCLMGTAMPLGVIPTGSGNGLARHFGIPLNPEKAIHALVHAVPKAVDVGTVDGHPFFVTCSMAWDARIAESFQKSPIRGVVPYIFAGIQEYFDYRPQPMMVRLDDAEPFEVGNALVFTVANLTQYGGGAIIAPEAREDDGMLELVIAPQQDPARFMRNLGRMFDGTLTESRDVTCRRFRTAVVTRRVPSPIQLDGDLLDAGPEVRFEVVPSGLNVLVPHR